MFMCVVSDCMIIVSDVHVLYLMYMCAVADVHPCCFKCSCVLYQMFMCVVSDVHVRYIRYTCVVPDVHVLHQTCMCCIRCTCVPHEICMCCTRCIWCIRCTCVWCVIYIYIHVHDIHIYTCVLHETFMCVVSEAITGCMRCTCALYQMYFCVISPVHICVISPHMPCRFVPIRRVTECMHTPPTHLTLGSSPVVPVSFVHYFSTSRQTRIAAVVDLFETQPYIWVWVLLPHLVACVCQ